MTQTGRRGLLAGAIGLAVLLMATLACMMQAPTPTPTSKVGQGERVYTCRLVDGSGTMEMVNAVYDMEAGLYEMSRLTVTLDRGETICKEGPLWLTPDMCEGGGPADDIEAEGTKVDLLVCELPGGRGVLTATWTTYYPQKGWFVTGVVTTTIASGETHVMRGPLWVEPGVCGEVLEGSDGISGTVESPAGQ